MSKETNLIKYIDYFKTENFKFYELKSPVDGSRILRYYDYHVGVLNFLDDFTKTNMIDYSYVVNIKKINLEKIEEASETEIGTIITYFLRTERFSDGTWAEAIENKIFLKCLERLKVLKEKVKIG